MGGSRKQRSCILRSELLINFEGLLSKQSKQMSVSEASLRSPKLNQ